MTKTENALTTTEAGIGAALTLDELATGTAAKNVSVIVISELWRKNSIWDREEEGDEAEARSLLGFRVIHRPGDTEAAIH